MILASLCAETWKLLYKNNELQIITLKLLLIPPPIEQKAVFGLSDQGKGGWGGQLAN